MNTPENQTIEPKRIASTSTKPRPAGSKRGNRRRNAEGPAVIERFRPFPTNALPEPVRSFVEAGAKAIGCDTSYLALPMLTMLAASIGNTRRIQLKRGWTAPANLWGVIVGESGTAKTPAFALVMRPIRERQQKAMRHYAAAIANHQRATAHYEKKMAEWRRTKKGSQPEKPDEPLAKRCIVSDTTVEALAPILSANPRGLLLACDELAAWFGSFDRYSSGKGSKDAAHWLSMFNGESIIVDRKNGSPRTIFVPQASVSICGGIQPGILNRSLGLEYRESGLAARLLLACPPRRPKCWTNADIDPESETRIAEIVERLHTLELTEGSGQPKVVELADEAKRLWINYYNSHAQEQTELVGELAAAWSKFEEYAPRLALVVHFTRWAANDPTLDDEAVVDAESIMAGIRLVTWFKNEARRVYAMLGESNANRANRRLAEWIEGQGGETTINRVRQGCRWLKSPGAAEAALKNLKTASYGDWSLRPSGERGGRPPQVFRLFSLEPVNETPSLSEEIAGFVDVDSAGADEHQSNDDEWAEAS